MTTLEELIVLARDWNQASRNASMGMGSASPSTTATFDRARRAFYMAAADLPRSKFADALIELDELRKKVKELQPT